MLIERAKRFEVEELVGKIPVLQKLAEDYEDVSEPIPIKRNRHMSMARKLSVQNSEKNKYGNYDAATIAVGMMNKNGLLATKQRHMRAQSNPKARGLRTINDLTI